MLGQKLAIGKTLEERDDIGKCLIEGKNINVARFNKVGTKAVNDGSSRAQ